MRIGDCEKNIKKLRENQEAVLKLLEKYGLENGIHCQATGTGKSLEILMYCNYFFANKLTLIRLTL